MLSHPRITTGPSRRRFLRISLGGAAGVTVSGLLPSSSPTAFGADDNIAPPRSAILLWMNGGPSQIDTFDPKPAHPNGGGVKAIPTSVGGIEIAEHLPLLARQMHHLSLIRSMTSKEGSHERGRYLLHTGYVPAGDTHPGFGSIISNELADPEAALPGFVSLGLPSASPGYLGMKHAAFHVADMAGKSVPNVSLPNGVTGERFDRRWKMLQSLEDDFIRQNRGPEAEDHRSVYGRAARFMGSAGIAAFDLTTEKDPVRDSYGRHPFGQGCLIARRLIEAGVRCVEVSLNGWDTHVNNLPATRELAAALDPAFSSLLADLAARDLLPHTLVAWMGEFGRTPGINILKGRDHWTRAWSVALAGGGIIGGKSIGQTSEDGTTILERPVTVPDLFATLCKATGINHYKEYTTPSGRPFGIVDKGKPVSELFS